MSSNKIPFDLLKGREDYDTWMVGASAYLTIKDMWVWTEAEPDASKPNEKSSDAKARGELTLLIDPCLYSYVAAAKTTKSAWEPLKNAFEDNGTSQKIFTLVKFFTTKVEDFSTREEYVNAMLTLWRKVNNAGYNIDEKTAGSLMLGRLPAEYRAMVRGIENIGAIITVDYAKNMILQDTSLNGDETETALAVKKNWKNKVKSKKPVKCYDCKGPHFRNKCPLRKNNKTENVVLYTSFEPEHFKSEKSVEWVIDSGATAHMTNVESVVKNKKQPKIAEVRVANDERLKISCVGEGKIKNERSEITQ